MNVIVLAVSGLALASCSTGSGGIAKVKPAGDASGLMVSSATAYNVAVCIADRFKTRMERNGDIMSVTAPTTPSAPIVTFRISAFDDPLNRYKTRVDVIGAANITQGSTAAQCLNPNAIPDPMANNA